MSPLITYLIAFLCGIALQHCYPIHIEHLFGGTVGLLVLAAIGLVIIRRKAILLDYRPCRIIALILVLLFTYTYSDLRSAQIKNYDEQGRSTDAERMQEVCREKLEAEKIEGKNLALINAIILGDKGLLSDEQKKAFRDTGTMHILVVSGMHVGLIYLTISIGFAIFGLKRNAIAKLVSIGLVWVYAITTGLAPSVCRASLMISFVVIIPIINARIEHKDAVYLSLIALLLYDPGLISSYSLWLSYISVYALIQSSWLIEKITDRIPLKIIRYAAQLCLVSCVCQVATAPIILSFNDYFPTFFAVNNLMIVPLLSPLLLLSIGVIATPHCIAQHIAPLVNYLLSMMDDYTQYAQTWHLASIHLPGYTSIEIAIMTITIVLLFTVIGAWRGKYRNICGYLLGISCLICTGYTIFLDGESRNIPDQLILWRRFDKTNISLYSDRRMTHYLADTTEIYSIRECERLRKEFRVAENKILPLCQPLRIRDEKNEISIKKDGVAYINGDIIDVQLLQERSVRIEL